MVICPTGEWGEYLILIFHARGVRGGSGTTAYYNMLIYYYAPIRMLEYADIPMLRAYNSVVFMQQWISLAWLAPVDKITA